MERMDRLDAEESEVERAWRVEIERRLFELQMGLVETIPAKDVFAELDVLIDPYRGLGEDHDG